MYDADFPKTYAGSSTTSLGYDWNQFFQDQL